MHKITGADPGIYAWGSGGGVWGVKASPKPESSRG